MELKRLELSTPCMLNRCSPSWAIAPIKWPNCFLNPNFKIEISIGSLVLLGWIEQPYPAYKAGPLPLRLQEQVIGVLSRSRFPGGFYLWRRYWASTVLVTPSLINSQIVFNNLSITYLLTAHNWSFKRHKLCKIMLAGGTWRDLNPQPSVCRTVALPIELHPHWWTIGESNS